MSCDRRSLVTGAPQAAGAWSGRSAVLPGAAPGRRAPVAQCPAGLRSPRRGPLCRCAGSLGLRRVPSQLSGGLRRGVWVTLNGRESTGFTCMGLFQAKNQVLLLRIIFMALLCFLSCQRDFQAFVSKSGEMPQTGSNQNSVCVPVCRILPGVLPARCPMGGWPRAQGLGTSRLPGLPV